MKLNELITKFVIATTNEEAKLLDKMDKIAPYEIYTEREQTVINNLVRKSLVSKINKNGDILVVKNSFDN